MKYLRLLTMGIIAVLIISVCVPTSVYAKQSGADTIGANNLNVNFDKAKLAILKVENDTGGTIYIRLSGPKNYSFAASKWGFVTFKNIEPGRYTIKVSSSACSGSLTFKRDIKGITVLKKMIVCKKK